ncbi:MAG TPA: DUF3105 domain-containing protein [Candidatus Limnocylindria bacterium]|nr:DUF3105 domain-containing protein [Candidatus Limnocylindria bacterium]
MTKRRTTGIQRRGRASEAAMSRRISPTTTSSALDPRLLLIGGVLVVGVVVLVVVFLFAGTSRAPVGQRVPNEGATHIAEGEPPTYQSRPATSGPHWNVGGGVAPLNWGVYTSPVAEPAAVHNLEHGGIVIWYQPTQATEEDVAALTQYVESQIQSARFKFLLSPWAGEDFGAPMAVTAWDWKLYLEAADIEQIRAFADDHYGDAPEPQGGPGQPAV